MRLGPFFGYYGSKHRMSIHYESPAFDTIIEPFAGSAGYSVLHHTKKVRLYDLNDEVCALWEYLIAATPEMIMKIPLIAPKRSRHDLDCSPEEKMLIGFWLGKGDSYARDFLSPRGIERHEIHSDAWGKKCRRRLARQVSLIKHWTIEQKSYADIDTDIEATWHIDPPYQVKGMRYPNGSRDIDFEHLGKWCKSLSGQVMVCESGGADWLPFEPFKEVNGVMNTASKEVVWLNRRFEPVNCDLFG